MVKIQNNFEEFSLTPHFLELNVNELVKIIPSSEDQNMIVYAGIIKWLNHKPEERNKDISL